MRSVRRSAYVLAAAASLAMAAVVTTPAVAATPAPSATQATAVHLEYGASYISGTLTFFNRSVGFTGSLRAVGCRRAWFSAYDTSGTSLGARSSSTHCDTTVAIPVTLPADVVGGAAYVTICMDDQNANPLVCQDYYR